MSTSVVAILGQLVGQPCTTQRVGRSKSLSLGFGAPEGGPSPLSGIEYASWEIGTYYCAWRILRQGRVVLSNTDSRRSIVDIRGALGNLSLGAFTGVRQLTDVDVRVELDNGIAIDFLTTISDHDETFHIFCPNDVSVVFFGVRGWETGPSNVGWRGSPIPFDG